MKFDFSDINLVPRKCVVDSRSDVSTSLTFGRHEFKMPVVPANMEAVIDVNLAKSLAKSGFFYIMHRFGNTLEFCREMKRENLLLSISIGVKQDSYDLIEQLIQENIIPDFITIDIAHGHAISMQRMIIYLKSKISSFIISGNVSTKDAVYDLQNWGADAIKVGIGNGSACTTYPSTGFGSRNCQASVILECASVSKVPIIADGGIKEPGDISKSLVMGASMVMIGGMLSGYEDSPGHVIEGRDGKKYKEFWGSASSHQSNKTNRIEGKKILIEYKDKTLLEGFQYLKECLESSISYSGGKDISCFNHVKWIGHTKNI